MEKKDVIAPAGVFRTPLLPAALVCCVLAAVCGAAPAIALTDPEYRQFLIRKILTGGVSSNSAVCTWSLINGAVSLLCVFCPAILAGGLAAALRGKFAQGFGFLSSAASLGLRGVNGVGILLAAVYWFRVVRYVIVSAQTPQGVMLIYSMLISEGFLGAAVWFLFRCLRNYVEGLGDAFASMAYTLSSGRIDNLAIPGSAERGFLVLGILCPVWAVNELVTVTIVADHIQSYYSLVLAAHPLEYLTAASLVLNGAVSILMFLYLRRYNRICEWEKFQARKQK